MISLLKGIDYIGVTVVFFCHDGRGNFLLAQRNQSTRDEQGCWDVGGGAIEFGESIEQTLQREIKEEYGAEIIDSEFLGFRDVHRHTAEGQQTHWIALDFKVYINPNTVKLNEPQKFVRLGWFQLDNLPTPLHSQLAIALEKYKTRLS